MTYSLMEIDTRDVIVKYYTNGTEIPINVRELFRNGISNGFVNGYIDEATPVPGERGVSMSNLACMGDSRFYNRVAGFIQECDDVEEIVSVEILKIPSGDSQ